MAVMHVKQEDFMSVVRSNEIVFVDFWATWCAPCRAFGPIFEKVSENHPEIAFIKVDIDENPDIAAEAEIHSIPTINVIKNGSLIWDHQGAVTAEVLELVIEEAKKLDTSDEDDEDDSEDNDDSDEYGN